MQCTVGELMVATLAATIEDSSVVYVGVGVPICLAAASLAKATHAPNAGVFPAAGLELRHPIMLTLRGTEFAAAAAGMSRDIAEIMNRTEGYGVLEPLAPAQIDRQGNANTIAIGPYDRPTVRLPGFAGADAVGSMPAWNVLYTTRHSPRVLVDQVDVVMTVGAGARRKLGATEGGPRRLVTNLAVFDWDNNGGWNVTSLHPGVSWQDVCELTGFPLPDRPPNAVTPEPSQEVLDTLRRRIDPFCLHRLEFTPARERKAVLREILAAERRWLDAPVPQC